MLERLIRHPMAVVFGALIIAVGGVASLRRLPVDLFPNLNYPLINIITHCPAGSAEDVERLITRPIENAVLGVGELQRVRSVSAPGLSQVTVEFTWGVDVLQARQMVSARLAQVTELPQGARPEMENIGTSLAMLSTYTLSGGDPIALRGWAQYVLAPRLESLPGVARVDVMGGGEAAYRIDLDPIRLRRRHVAASAVAEAIQAQHVLDTGGYIGEQGRDVFIRTDGRIQTLDDLRRIAVANGPDGWPVRLDDVAEVYSGAKPQRYTITSDRRVAVAFTIQKQPEASTLAVSRAVDAALAELPPPPGVRLMKFYDQAEIIGLAYRNMRDNLLVGALLAVAALVWVLGRRRTTLVVAVTIPLAVLGTFVAMRLVGFGINLMTLGAITVAIGMVVDDSIVVLENIMRHRQEGLAPRDAALIGTREILAPDVAGTLTTLAAFLPLALVTGLAGRLFQPFGVTFSTLLALSLLFSLTLIPAAAAHTPARPHTRTLARHDPRWLTWLTRQNLRLFDLLKSHRVAAIGGIVLLFAGSVALLALNPVRFLPLLDEDSLLLSYQLAPGTSLAESNRVGDALEQLCLSLPGVAGVFRRTGSPEQSFLLEGPDQGEIVLRLAQNAEITATELKADLERRLASLPGIITRVNEPTSEKIDESFSGLPALFGITVFGQHLEMLHAAAASVEQAAWHVSGLANVVNNTKVPVDQVTVSVNRDRCAQLGVEARTVADAVRIAMQGETVADVIIGQQPIALFVRCASEVHDSLAALSQVLVPGPHGDAIPLGQLARIERGTGYPTIEHQHGVRALTLTAEIEGNPFAVMNRLGQAIASLRLPPEIQVAYTGEYRQLLETAVQWLWVLALSALLVYGIMAIQFGNALDPAIVLLKLPIDFMGAALALFLTRQPLDLTVLIGFVTLIGVSVNNGIMLVSFIQKFRQAGMDLEAAVRRAVTVRLRPTLLTNLTTLLALIPAAVGLERGPQLLQPLGVMLFGGLAAGTLLTLNLLPVLYLATERWRGGTQPNPLPPSPQGKGVREVGM